MAMYVLTPVTSSSSTRSNKVVFVASVLFVSTHEALHASRYLHRVAKVLEQRGRNASVKATRAQSD